MSQDSPTALKFTDRPPFSALKLFLFTRFQKNDILRVMRALAIYRPSMIALQTPMSDEDFVFMEKCLRRSLIVSLPSRLLGT